MKIVKAFVIGIAKMTVFFCVIPLFILGILLMIGGDDRLLTFMDESKIGKWMGVE